MFMLFFETYSIQTKIGTYFKNKFVHDLNEYKLFRKTKKKWLQKDKFQYEIFTNIMYQIIWKFTFLQDLKNYFDPKNKIVPHIPNWELNMRRESGSVLSVINKPSN